MRTVVLAALACSAPIGAVVGALFKLDARARGWSDRSALVFILVGALACSAGMALLVLYFGGFRPESP